MKRIISMLLAMIMVLSTVSVFAEETTEEVITASEETQELCIGKEVEYGSDLYSIRDDGLYVSKNYGKDTLMDEGTITWLIERDGVLYWSKHDEYNTDIYRMNLSSGSKTTLTRLFAPVKAFDVVGDDVYYLYNGEITILNVLTNEEFSMGMYDCEGFYVDEKNDICSVASRCRNDNAEVELMAKNTKMSDAEAIAIINKVKDKTVRERLLTIYNKYNYGSKNESRYYDNLITGQRIDACGWTCFGFGRYVIMSLFSDKKCWSYVGSTSKYYPGNADGDFKKVIIHNNSTSISGSDVSVETLKNIFSKVKAGAFIQSGQGYDRNGKNQTHTLVYVYHDDDYIYTYEGNSMGDDLVYLLRYKWEDFDSYLSTYGRYTKDGISYILMPKTYTLHTCTYGSNGKCTDKSCGAVYMGEDISASNLSDLGIYKSNGSGGVDAFTAPNKNSIYTPKSGKKVNTDTVHVVAVVKNNNGTYNYQVTYGSYGKSEKRFVNRNDFKKKYTKNADLPSTIAFNDMNAPETLDKGKSFGLRGTITSNYSLSTIKGYIVRASDNKTILSVSDSGGSSYVMKSGKINKNLKFNTLSPDTYYLKYEVWDSNNGHEVWTSSNFKVGNVGTVPTLRAGDITGGKKIDISCSDKNAIIKYTVDGGKEQSISAGGSKTIEFKTAGNHTVVAWSVSGTTVSTKGTQSVKIEKAWLPTIIDWFKRKAGALADIDVEYGNTSAQVIISGEGDIYYTLNGSNPTTSSAKYTGPVEIKNSCTVKAISVQQGYAPSDVATKDIIIREPDAPSIQLSNTKQKIAQGKTATVSWSKVNYATKYVAYLYYNGECVDTYETTGTSASFKLPEVGKYTINVKAHNFVGYSPESNSVLVMSMAPVTVTIIDRVIREGKITDDVINTIQTRINEHDGDDAIKIEENVVSVQKIDYDSLPARPMTPSKKGFTFAGYDEGLYTPATENKTVYALYEVNYYTVEFWNSYYGEDGITEITEQIAETQEVMYTDAAILPDVTSPDGYSFSGWNVDNTVSTGYDYNYVDGNIKLFTSYTWANKNLPAIVQITHAERDEKCTSYAVDVKYINNNFNNDGTQARLIISLYTTDGRMIYTQTEDVDMDKFNIGQTLNDTITLNYIHNVAKVSAVLVQVKNDRTGGAISEMVSTNDIEYPDTSGYWAAWSGWSTDKPTASDTRQVDSKTQYRYRDKQYTTSNSTKSLSGWNYYSTNSSTGNWIDNGTGWVGEENSDYRRREVSSTWHDTYKQQWLYSRAVGWSTSSKCWKAYGWATGICQTVEGTGWLDYRLPYEGEGPCGSKWGKGWIDGKNVYWYNEVTRTVKDGGYNTYKYRDTYYTHNFWKWGNWSGYSDSRYYASNEREVSTRTLYRYRDYKLNYPGYDPSRDSTLEEQTIETFDISGNVEGLDKDYSGKKATVMVYKKTNSDPTQEQLQYVNQITLGSNNSYSFTVNPKEKIDYATTGDYIVTLAIEGSDKLVNIDTIKAPVPTYEVNFYVDEGVKFGETQYVEYGDGVDVNTVGIPEKEGYRFVKWDKSVVNITRNISVNAIFEPIEYSIVFVDHENATTEIQELAYGETIAAPPVTEIEGKTFIGWDGISSDEETLVTGTQIINALWENEIYTVNFCDFNGNIIGETQEVEYGEAAEVPECLVIDGITYPWDTNNAEWWNVTHDMTIYPYVYEPNDLSAPASDVESGSYDEYLLVNLSSDEDATIYYSMYDITEEDALHFVELQEMGAEEPTETVSLMAGESTTTEETTTDSESSENEETENDYSYLNDIIVEYNEAIPVTGSTIIYAFTVKDGEFSPISAYEYEINEFVPEEEETVLDETAEQITIPAISAKPGETVSVPVMLKNNPGLNNLSIVLGYDSEKFTLVSTENGEVFADEEFSEELKEDGSCKFTWSSETDNISNGILVTMEFKVADNIPEGEYDILFSDATAQNSAEEEQYLVLVNGSMVNADGILGDVNGDEEVDFADAIQVLKFDAGLTEFEDEQLTVGDVNGDEEVDFADAIQILKFDAGLIEEFSR